MSNDNIHERVRRFQKALGEPARDEYYADTAARIDTIIGKESKWVLRLQRAKAEWDQQWKAGNRDHNFPQYLAEVYGVKMKMEEVGVSLAYDILDEQKHTVFLLKFGA